MKPVRQLLNRGGSGLRYANEAVYPWYILHQAVLLLLATRVVELPWGILPKFLLLAAGTFVISAL